MSAPDVDTASAPEQVETGPGAARWWRPELYTYLASGFLTILSTIGALHLWRADLRVPFVYYGDAIAVGTHFKTVIETGWYESQPRLGAPAGQTYHDFPTADNLHLIAARVASWFTQDWALAMNAYYLLGFLLSALAAVWFLRQVGVSRTFTVVLSVLFAIAPYHFMRGEGHLWLASYYTLPLGLVVVLRAVRGDALWSARASSRVWWGRLTGRGLSTVLALALVATASTYYAVFVLLLLATAGLAAWIRDRDWRRFAGAVVAGVVAVVAVLINMAPDLLYARANGPSAAGLVRSPTEVEIYALKLSQLLLPVPGHRVPILDELRTLYDSNYPLTGENPSLGFVAAFGFVATFVVMGVVLAGRSRVRFVELRPDQVERTRTLSLLGLLTLVAFLFATIGGLATLISFLTASLRGWNRMSIVLMALALAAAGLVFDALMSRITLTARWSRRTASVVSAGAALAVLGFGYLDQVTPGATEDYAATGVAFRADADTFGRMEAALPAEALVFNLPFVPFPETDPVNGAFYTDQLKPYLHTDALRFSAAGIKGRASTDWPAAVSQQAPARMVTDLAASGFDAILVDSVALGAAAGTTLAGLDDAAGPAVDRSADGRWTLYSLADARASVEDRNSSSAIDQVADAVLRPVIPYVGPGAGLVPGEVDEAAWRLPTGEGTLNIDNARDTAVPVRLSARVTSDVPAADVTFLVAGQSITVPFVDGVATLDRTLDMPPGQTPLTTQTTAGWVDLDGGLRITEVGVPTLVP